MTVFELVKALNDEFVGVVCDSWTVSGKIRARLKEYIDDSVSSSGLPLATYSDSLAYECWATAMLEHSRDNLRPITQVARVYVKRKKQGDKFVVKDIEILLYGGAPTVEDALARVFEYVTKVDEEYEAFVNDTLTKVRFVLNNSGISFRQLKDIMFHCKRVPEEELCKLK